MSDTDQRSKLLPGIGLVLRALVLGLVIGAWVGSFFVSSADGLAGGAIVLGYGVVAMLVALVLGIVLVRYLPRRKVLPVLMIAGPIALILLALGVMRFMEQKRESDRQWQEEQERMKQLKPTAPATPVMFASFQHGTPDHMKEYPQHDRPMGMGMASPNLAPGVLRFYSRPDMDQLPEQFKATDSLVFVQGTHQLDIAHAPPWFVPAHLKLDYGLLLLRVITISRNWVEVEVNNMDGRTLWLDRSNAQVVLWEEFIMNVVAMEILDPEANPIRIKPLDHAAILADGANALLKPLAVRGDWLLVSTHEFADRIQPTGWVRWRKGERLLVEYSLLC